MMTKPSPLLLGSLALNFILIGVLAGVFMSRSNTSPPQDRAPSERSQSLRDASPQTRQAVRNALNTSRQAAEHLRQQHSDAREALHQILSNPNYDKAETDAAFARLRETQSAIQEALQTSLSETMTDLTSEQRLEILNRVNRQQRPRRGQRERRRRSPN